MLCEYGLKQLREARAVCFSGQNLVGVGASLRPYGRGLASPNQLGAAAAEVSPAPQRMLAGHAGGVAVPTLHRMDAPAVADREIADPQRRRQRRSVRGR